MNAVDSPLRMGTLARSSSEQRQRTRAALNSVAVDISCAKAAFGLAVGSLLLAGCFSLFLIIGRAPVISHLIGDPHFFKRCLVFHVDLALIVWFFSFAAGLFALVPGDRWSHWYFKGGISAAVTGVALMCLGILVPNSEPILANYVPVINNPLYLGGVALLFSGLFFCFCNPRLGLPAAYIIKAPGAGIHSATRITSTGATGSLLSPDTITGLKATAVAFVLAVTTMFISWIVTPRVLDAKSYYELVFWGGGHVLQVANVAAMLSVWLVLLWRETGTPILTQRQAGMLFGLLLAPHFVAPLLTLGGTTGPVYRVGFTRLMQFGIFPAVTILLGICIHKLWKSRSCRSSSASIFKSARFIGFAASASLTLTGFGLGSAIRNSNTMIPAHYHASIGAVTLAFMAISYELLEPLGIPGRESKLRKRAPLQLICFGAGQIIFAIGFALGGAHGLSRKAYGAEQHIRSLAEHAGLWVMAVGGLVAVLGGVLYLAFILQSIRGSLAGRFKTYAAHLLHPGATPKQT